MFGSVQIKPPTKSEYHPGLFHFFSNGYFYRHTTQQLGITFSIFILVLHSFLIFFLIPSLRPHLRLLGLSFLSLSSPSSHAMSHLHPFRSRTGRKGPYAGYYLQIKPSGSFIGAGLWQPEAAPLALMRQSIDTQPHLLKTVLLDRTMRREFLKGVPAGDEGKAVKAFVEKNKENMLKTKPKVSAILYCTVLYCAVLNSAHLRDPFFRLFGEESDGFPFPVGST